MKKPAAGLVYELVSRPEDDLYFTAEPTVSAITLIDFATKFVKGERGGAGGHCLEVALAEVRRPVLGDGHGPFVLPVTLPCIRKQVHAFKCFSREPKS